MTKFSIITYGCQINEYESGKFKEVFLELGLEEANEVKEADIVLFNSCSVREKSEEKLMSRIGYIRSLYEERGYPQSIVTGCVATNEEKRIRKVGKESVLLVMKGTESLAERMEKVKETILNLANTEALRMKKSNVFEFVPVIFGCDTFCTYCIVPIVKGRERSRPLGEIIQEVEGLTDRGAKEIILLGQNINHYGNDIGISGGFVKLIECVDKVPGVMRLRFLTSHPADFNKEVIEKMRGLTHLCPHFHIPLQSGSNRILQLMKRNYTVGEYLSLIYEILETFPDASITTDLIVGFPSESEEDFYETLSVVEALRFDRSFIAAYSKRPNTPASRMEGQVDEETKRRRLNELLDIQNNISLEKNLSYVGKKTEVLVEAIDRGKTYGRNPQDKLVEIEGKVAEIGSFVEVYVTDGTFTKLKGRIG